MTASWQEAADFYRLRPDGAQVPGYRALAYTAFGAAVAASWHPVLVLMNAAAVFAVFACLGAYDNLWDWRREGQRNGTRAVLESRGLSWRQDLAWSAAPMTAALVLWTCACKLGMPRPALALAVAVMALAAAYVTPPVRLKDRPGSFVVAPLLAAGLFLQAYAVGGAPMRPTVLVLAVLAFGLQCHAECLHRLDDAVAPAAQWRRLRWLPKVSLSGSLLAAVINPVFLNTAVWSLVRWRAAARLRPEEIRMARRQVWRPIWSLYEFGIYGMAAAWWHGLR